MSAINKAVAHIEDPAVRLVVRDLLFNLDDRRDFHLSGLDDDVLAEWATDWAAIVAGLDLRRAQSSGPQKEESKP